MNRSPIAFAVLSLTAYPVLFGLARGNPPATQGGSAVGRNLIARGEYLVTAGGCHDCHTPKSFTPRGPVPDMSRSLSGTLAAAKVPAVPAGVLGPNAWGALVSNDMTIWAGPWGVSFAANLTPDKATGLGSWTETAFVNALRTGKHKGVLRDILPPMPWQATAKLTDEDLKSISAYLQSIKPINNKVPDPIPPGK
jgi:hypothetical protein